MKIQPASTLSYQAVTACDGHSVDINGITCAYSLIVLPEIAPIAWPVTSFDELTPEHFALIEAMEPDVVLLGTGQQQRFARPELTAALFTRRIGVECMDNRAACRTYSLLMSEGRKVALALIFDQEIGDLSGV